MADAEAWTALAAVYLRKHMFAYAAFCCEELVLANPYNYAFHLMLAEVSWDFA